MRVLIVTPAYPPGLHVGGGVAITYQTLYNELKKKDDVEVTVLSTWNGELDYINTVFDKEFRVINPNKTNVKRIKAEIRRADVVVYPDNFLLPVMVMETALREKPCIWVFHTNFLRLAQHHMRDWEHKLFTYLTNTALGVASRSHSHVLTTSRDFTKYLREHGYKIDGYINQGFKTAIFQEHDDPQEIGALKKHITDGKDRPIMLFAGRLSNEKRIHLLVKAKPTNFVLLIIGDGYLRDQLKELSTRMEGIKVITEMMPQAQLRKYYKAADIVVSASDFETYGMTIHESLICGTPVVVEDAKGFRNQVVNGQNGFLIKYDDTKVAHDQLIRALDFDFTAVRPNPDAEAIDFTEFVCEVGRSKRAPIPKWRYVLYVILEMCYILLMRFLRIFYEVKQPADDSKLDVGPKALHKQHEQRLEEVEEEEEEEAAATKEKEA